MKLWYFHGPATWRNFGDDLNPWLWSRLLPDVFDDDPSTLFVGIGTILNNRLPKADRTIVFSSGVGYGTGLPTGIDDSWTFYCVRGPQSAARLGLAPDTAVTDGAVLVRTVYLPRTPKRYRTTYMPHVYNVRAYADGQPGSAIQVIDPRWPVEQILDTIAASEVLLTEALHGAIVADALRVPWVPIVTSPRVLRSKWQDWTASVGLEYRPQRLGWLHHHEMLTQWQRVERVLNQQTINWHLRRLARRNQPLLSSEPRLQLLTNQLEGRLDRFRRDVRSGRFATVSSNAI